VKEESTFDLTEQQDGDSEQNSMQLESSEVEVFKILKTHYYNTRRAIVQHLIKSSKPKPLSILKKGGKLQDLQIMYEEEEKTLTRLRETQLVAGYLLRLVKAQKYGDLSQNLDEVDELLEDLPVQYHDGVSEFFEARRSNIKESTSPKPPASHNKYKTRTT
jgi:hypothetical protein